MRLTLKDLLVKLLSDIFSEKLLLRFSNPFIISSRGVEAVPLWVKITNYFWSAFIFFSIFLSLTISIRYLFFRKNKNIEIDNSIIVIGGFLGSILYSISSFIVFPSQIHRFLMYPIFFTIPIMMSFLIRSGENRNRVTVFLMIFLLSFSLPTFLAGSSLQKHIFSIYMTHGYEHGMGNFLEKNFGTGKGLTVFMESQFQYGIMPYYVPEALYLSEKEGAYASIDASPERLQYILLVLVREFRSSKKSIFIFSPRSTVDAQHFFGIHPNSIFWLNIRDELDFTNQIYNNGYVELYFSD
jgi:hypothetical protein